MGVLVGKDGFYGNGFRMLLLFASQKKMPVVHCECIICYGLLNDEEVKPPIISGWKVSIVRLAHESINAEANKEKQNH
ncbi:hypothetical protein CUMW_226640 [Citrus unshiu]|uniref:Uncharacterized protein n=1 Tax=Citrus unshiu TaxID=55188 RepID=A0A2H5QG10_CITUN|nr:hypothetical protein CUMW_226640 [Citrus unshiu]